MRLLVGLAATLVHIEFDHKHQALLECRPIFLDELRDRHGLAANDFLDRVARSGHESIAMHLDDSREVLN